MKCEATTHHKSTNYHSAFDAVCGGEMELKGQWIAILDYKLYQCKSCKDVKNM
jgi:hypothetical protein